MDVNAVIMKIRSLGVEDLSGRYKKLNSPINTKYKPIVHRKNPGKTITKIPAIMASSPDAIPKIAIALFLQ